MMNLCIIPQSSYLIEPWKNGLGSTDIVAEARIQGGPATGWDGLVWRLARTEIASASAFSDHTGYDRHQVVVEGEGLFLDAGSATIDLSEALKPVQYGGELKIVSRLENGSVKVLNLMINRSEATGGMTAMGAGSDADFRPGAHVFYAVKEDAHLCLTGTAHHVSAGDAIALEAAEPFVATVQTGTLIAASIYAK